MYKSLQIAIVIPAYCEETRIADVVRAMPAWVDQIVVVDDASTDQTAAHAAAVGDPRVVVVRLPENQGVGGATVAGMNRALELGADILVKMDGDGQMDPTFLPALLEPLQSGAADYTKGNRFLHAREISRMPWVRRVGNIGLSFMAKVASGYWQIFDPTNGYLAITAGVFRMLDQARLHRRFFFENSLLLELGLNRAVVRDVYLPARYNEKVSHLSEFRTLLEFPPLLLRGLLRRILMQYFVRDFSAASLFLIAGSANTLFGAVWGAYHWYESSVTNQVASTGTVMIAVMPMILGIQFLLQAVVMDVQNVPREPIHPTGGTTHS